MKKINKGVFICLSGNANLNIKSLKEFIFYMHSFGYNYIELGLDDMVKISEEPYYGYLRGGYNVEELKEVVDYAKELDMEVIPSCQVLGHFSYLKKIPEYENIIDIDDILLVDEPRTYVLIENIFKTLREAFTTNKINIAFDEAHHVGLGKYLDKHGYTDRYELLIRHLNKVKEIAEKYNFHIEMWSDMFFKLVNKGIYYSKDVSFTNEQLKIIPEGVHLNYWDYFTTDSETLKHMMSIHKSIDNDFTFAGSICGYCGFAPHNIASIKILEKQIKVAKEVGVTNYLITLWPDDGNDCSYFSLLPGLYQASKLIGEDKINLNDAYFQEITGISYNQFILLDELNRIPTNKDLDNINLVDKSLLYNDCFLGLKDYELIKVGHIDYKDIANKYESAIVNIHNDRFERYFITLRDLSICLSYKYDLGIKTRHYYLTKDKESLKKLLPIYDKVLSTLLTFTNSFYNQWMQENKPHGWDIQQLRLGGLYFRIKNCKERLIEYIDNEVDKIEELEEILLSYAKFDSLFNSYQGFISIRNL